MLLWQDPLLSESTLGIFYKRIQKMLDEVSGVKMFINSILVFGCTKAEYVRYLEDYNSYPESQ